MTTQPKYIDPMVFWGTEIFRFIEQDAPHFYATTKQLSAVLPDCFPNHVGIRCQAYPQAWIVGRALHIAADFRFDGASGPAIDGIGNMLAALVHDALCGLKAAVPAANYSWADADRAYRVICVAQGAGRFRAWYHWAGLRSCGWAHRLIISRKS